jgi:hypothetical protein
MYLDRAKSRPGEGGSSFGAAYPESNARRHLGTVSPRKAITGWMGHSFQRDPSTEENEGVTERAIQNITKRVDGRGGQE